MHPLGRGACQRQIALERRIKDIDRVKLTDTVPPGLPDLQISFTQVGKRESSHHTNTHKKERKIHVLKKMKFTLRNQPKE
jgi:hypothetical protein